VEETVAWLRERPYYDGQITEHRVRPGREASTRDLDVEPRLASALSDRGVQALYDHQARAVEAVRAGRNAVLATPTASGKSLAYTVPAFERAMDHLGTTLYVAPQVALINDQAETLSELADGLGFGSRVTVDRYTGRLSRSEKAAVRDRQPTVLLTTPDMLHSGLLPHASRLWDWFFKRLETVVLDEIHAYRGVFGSHVGLVARRLDRVCERFGADPDWVCCSATVGNPVEHAATVTGRDPGSFAAVETDTSATGPTHWLLWNPPADGRGTGRRRSRAGETRRLFVDLVARGHQTLAFSPSRQGVERQAGESADALRERGRGDLATAVTAYQAALPDDRRETVEAGLESGEVRGVWSTSALELGVDVGGLDAVLLDGYPGTRTRTVQQAGRAGRGTEPSLVVLVAGEDQLDQYVAANPGVLFDAAPERAITDPENRRLLPDHLRAAASERWLRSADRDRFGERFPDAVADLTEAGDLSRRTTDAGVRWLYDGAGSPQHDTGLRAAGDRTVQLRTTGGEAVGSLGLADALRDAHPGAVYHHQGQRYEVVDLDLGTDVATLDRTWADYHTRPLHEKSITVDRDRAESGFAAAPAVTLRFADVTMRKRITGYERRQGGETLGRRSLELPETTLETEALYYALPADLEEELRGAGGFAGGIHAAEHAMIATFPFQFLCDRRDVGGLSTPVHPHTGRPTVFVYDGHPGGVGLARAAVDAPDDLAATTRDLVAACDCADGCPACVQSPHCGNANDPLDKGVARRLLDALTG